jgi:hypothetical protein
MEDQINDHLEELNMLDKLKTMYIDDEPMLDYEDKPTSNSPTCWGRLQDEEYSPSFPSANKVPAGIYEIVWKTKKTYGVIIVRCHLPPHI